MSEGVDGAAGLLILVLSSISWPSFLREQPENFTFVACRPSIYPATHPPTPDRSRSTICWVASWANPIDFVIIAQPATPESSFRVPIHQIQFSGSVPCRHGQSTLLSEEALPHKVRLPSHSWHYLRMDSRRTRI